MKILGINTGHDGHICLIENGMLVFSHESEKNSGARYAPLSLSSAITNVIQNFGDLDAIAVSGWAEGVDPRNTPTEGGYLGLNIEQSICDLGGKDIIWINCSHEISHIISSYALSPYADKKACYVLLWEGFIGNFYKIAPDMEIQLIGEVMQGPGLRYAFTYGLADPTFNLKKGYCRLGDAGKMMALAAFGKGGEPDEFESKVIDYIINCESAIDTLNKAELIDSGYYNIGVDSAKFCNLAKKLSDRLFSVFYEFVSEHITEKLPLLISGGCGLNCEWNKKWEVSGLFEDIFVPPCTNDTGVGIGASAVAQKILTGNVELKWSVYSGQPFISETVGKSEFSKSPLVLKDVCEALLAGEIVCWVQGNCEIGPRALGNRSIIAAPFSRSTTEKLNIIKQREHYRPVAPICIEDDAKLYFENCTQSKFMLSFHNVIDKRLKAITHIDGTARVQTINYKDNINMYNLLSEFKKLSGVSVLCNTSLNTKGRGFINSLADLELFCLKNKISMFVVDQTMYRTNWAEQ
ncbi:carbamoyltransferase C-terminal domain-containing protein [Pseudomonas sp. R37(2017)]|uniref:carbamoyltransferase C-terminal domain-containing protein n=1 Tax=Pseudomonas sp. R37(2017) TaxID=1981685 RepID=UPI000A1E6A19|nr:carbamoyltransferase C-terminal domain-containing protein [Pseudomonas sp. R37(2017)]